MAELDALAHAGKIKPTSPFVDSMLTDLYQVFYLLFVVEHLPIMPCNLEFSLSKHASFVSVEFVSMPTTLLLFS